MSDTLVETKPSSQKSFLGGILSKKLLAKTDVTEVVDQALDEALERLAASFSEHEEVCAKVRRRQSSGELKLTLSERPPEHDPKLNGNGKSNGKG